MYLLSKDSCHSCNLKTAATWAEGIKHIAAEPFKHVLLQQLWEFALNIVYV